MSSIRLRAFRSLTLAPVLALAPQLACSPAPEEPAAADVAAYFGLVDGAERVFRSENGLEETHSFTRNGGFGEREVYERVVRRGGFVEDELTLRFEASVERGLEILRFHDCVTKCGELSEPIAFLPWPLRGGESLESDVEVTVSRNGEVQETRAEHHAVQVGNEMEHIVAAGTFSAFQVLWSKRVGDEEPRSVQIVVAPEEGLIVSEGFSGGSFELQP